MSATYAVKKTNRKNPATGQRSFAVCISATGEIICDGIFASQEDAFAKMDAMNAIAVVETPRTGPLPCDFCGLPVRTCDCR